MTSYNWLRKKAWEFYLYPFTMSEKDTELCEEYVRAERYMTGGGIQDGIILEGAVLETIDTSHRPQIKQ